MFFHFHPFKPFIFNDTKYLIIGTLPPPRFCTKNLKKNDVDFCYGSQDNLLWQVLDKIYKLNLLYDNSKEAIKQRKEFLIKKNIGICDIVESCFREKIDASDLGMKDIKLRDILKYLNKYKNIQKIIFTGKNSKNSPEYFFRKTILNNYKLEEIKNSKIRTHKLIFNNRQILVYSLTSPSNAANRSIGTNKDFKEKKLKNPNYKPFDFRYEEYKLAFLNS
ncbi:DNA glycosylase [Malaciobacter mytili LMG 24559]|uniref:DNA glycosylase n=1 Tax=Malaciobacter mytili LMG 24559 TaxID=1032238 RepID=A0AAX2AJ26_9BACT|nr:uracil-DNA glycosylase family protein [Malaciobacter mytili]AXH15926.1 Mug-like uracil-DNA glycosylase [Malaciobacter mytili LMG 24559]RXK15943.1 DNA glycosylase [Malaciobacter mytili LMG 24559]